MNATVSYVVEATAGAILLFWVLTHAAQFGIVTQSVAQGTVGGFRTLIGR